MIQRLIFFIFLFSSYFSLFAQEPITAKLVSNNQTLLGDTIPPQFPGGEFALYRYLSDNIKYPPVLIKIKMEGSLYLKFNINKKGEAENINIINGFDPDADAEVLRAMQMMPKWTPASIKDTPVDFSQFITITFTVTDELLEELKRPKENKPIRTDSLIAVVPKDSIQIIEEPIIEPVIDSLNTDPQFRGGKEALETYLKTNMKYPKRAIEYRIEGRVIFNIEVSPEGEITKIWLFKGLFPDCNEEAFYLINKMPKWIPGLKDGMPVAKQIMLPIPFELP